MDIDEGPHNITKTQENEAKAKKDFGIILSHFLNSSEQVAFLFLTLLVWSQKFFILIVVQFFECRL